MLNDCAASHSGRSSVWPPMTQKDNHAREHKNCLESDRRLF